jgi:hypothetical protein
MPDDARVLPNCMAKAKGERAPLIGGAVLRTPDLSSLTVCWLHVQDVPFDSDNESAIKVAC